MSSVIVLGAGVSGLSSAFYLLKEKSYRVTILEASSRIGGWISSQTISDGILFEQGARSLRPVGEAGWNTLKLLDDLNLSNSINPLTKLHPASRNRYIYVNKILHPLPNRISSLFGTHPPFTKPLITAVWNDLKTAPKIADDDTIYDFTERRFGREIADYLVSPLICGICAGDARVISVRFLMEKMFEREQTYGSIVKGLFRELISNKLKSTADSNINDLDSSMLLTKAIMERWITYTLKGGTYLLPRTLAGYVERNGAEISVESSCERINLKEKYIVSNEKNQRRKLHFDYLFSCLPANRLAPLLKDDHDRIANLLEAIPHVTVATVNLAYRGDILPTKGFGFLVPPRENLPLLGVTYDSCLFGADDGDDRKSTLRDEWTILTAMLGGYAFERHFGQNPTEDTLTETTLKYLKEILNISVDPVYSRINVLTDCIPQYVVGHRKTVNDIFDTIRNDRLPLFLVGNAYHGVGINDVILSAKNEVTRLKVCSNSV